MHAKNEILKCLSLRFFLVTAVVAGTLLLPFTASSRTAHDIKLNPDDLVTLVQLPKEIDRAISVATKANVSAWFIDTKCTGPMRIGFGRIGLHVSELIKLAENYRNSFNPSFNPIRDWARSLPEFSAKFDAASTTILNFSEGMKEGVAPTEAQRSQVIAKLQEISTNLEQAKAQLKKGAAKLASFLKNHRTYQQNIKKRESALIASIPGTIERSFSQVLKLKGCAKSVAKTEFNKAVKELRSSIDSITTAFTTMHQRAKEANANLTILLDSMAILIGRYHQVSNEWNTVQDAQLGSLIQRLRLHITRSAWQRLAEAATAANN